MADSSNTSQSKIDLSKIVCDLNGKLDNDLGNLTENINGNIDKLVDAIHEQSFTIIYPNNGSERYPAELRASSTYIEPNPFPGYYVICQPEILYKEEWGCIPWSNHGSYNGEGITCFLHNDDFISITVGTYITFSSSYKYTILGHSWVTSVDGNVTVAPVRIKVWKVGKMPEKQG